MSQKTEYDFLNGQKLYINMSDVDFVERFEMAFEYGRNEELKLPKTGKISERLKKEVELYETVIDKLFGDGTSEKLFCDSKDYTIREDVVAQIVEIAHKQQNEINTRKTKSIIQKYLPQGRR